MKKDAIKQNAGKLGGQVGGKSRSPAKVETARENGAKGGRPRLKKVSKWGDYKRKRRAEMNASK